MGMLTNLDGTISLAKLVCIQESELVHAAGSKRAENTAYKEGIDDMCKHVTTHFRESVE